VNAIMKKTILLIAIALTTLSASAEVLEGIVIRVGDRIITRSQYERRLRDGFAEIDQSVRPEQAAAAREELRKRLADDLVSELLIKDRADRLNIAITDAEVKEAVERLKQQNGIENDQQFESSLRNSGLTRAEMEARLRETLLTQKVFSRELRRNDLSDTELRERYNREKEQYRLPERAHLREIVILKPEGDAAKLAEVRQHAAEVAEAARKPGTAFASVASTMSESGTRDKGGDLGEVAKGDLVADLDKAVFSAPAGTIIGPLETKSAWHIMLVEQRLPSEVPAFESVKDRFRRDATEETFQRDYQNYIDALRKDAFVQINQEMMPKS
jgi:parvulin-like peptidyl-prolyl isomerase